METRALKATSMEDWKKRIKRWSRSTTVARELHGKPFVCGGFLLTSVKGIQSKAQEKRALLLAHDGLIDKLRQEICNFTRKDLPRLRAVISAFLLESGSPSTYATHPSSIPIRLLRAILRQDQFLHDKWELLPKQNRKPVQEDSTQATQTMLTGQNASRFSLANLISKYLEADQPIISSHK